MAPFNLNAFKSPKKLTKLRIGLALAVSASADFLQVPLGAASLTGVFALPGEAADLVVDFMTAAIVSALLGFHWALLPTFFVELVPGVDMAPTWTACTALVIYQRKVEEKARGVKEVPTEEKGKTMKVVTPLPVNESPNVAQGREKPITVIVEEVETPGDTNDRTRKAPQR